MVGVFQGGRLKGVKINKLLIKDPRCLQRRMPVRSPFVSDNHFQHKQVQYKLDHWVKSVYDSKWNKMEQEWKDIDCHLLNTN